MANDGNGDNNIDALRQFLINPRPPPLFPLPENSDVDVTIPMPMTPSEFKNELKNRIIYGSQREASALIDTLSQNPSPSSSASTSYSDVSTLDLLFPSSESVIPKSTRQKFHRSKTAPPMAGINERSYPIAPETELSDSQSIVRQAVVYLIVYLSLGALIYWLSRESFVVVQTHPVVDAIYFCIVTMCTIGYGDITPDSVATKVFSIMFVLVGFGFIDTLLGGMIAYVLELQERYMLEAAQKHSLEHLAKKKSYLVDVHKGRMRIRLKVGLALGVVVLCLGFGVLIMHFVEKIDWFDSFYFSVMSVTTVGYGDRAFKTMPGRLIAAIWLLVSTLAVAQAFLYLAEARVDKRSRKRAKKVIDETMSISQFLAADMDHNGAVSRAEYRIYKLIKMEKISEKDIIPIDMQFDKLDPTNSGRITLLDLLETSTSDLSTATSV